MDVTNTLEKPHEASPIVIRANNLSKHFTIRKDNSLKERLVAFGRGRTHKEEFEALKNINLEISAGSTVALIGHNGSGKSTLLKILGGIIDPSSGVLQRRGRIAALLELGAGFHPDLTGRDNVFLNASLLGLSRSDTAAVFEDIVAFSEIGDFIDTQVKFYSSGMYVRLAFAVAIHTDPEILLIDEVLAVGDEAFQRKCISVIKRFQREGRTILLVTHDLSQVVDLADTAVLLHHGQQHFIGEPSKAVSVFRDLLEEARIENELVSLKRGETIPALGTAASAEFVGRFPENHGETGDTLQVSVDVTAQLASSGWVCGLQLNDAAGRNLVSTDTKLLGLDLEPLDGKIRFVFTCKDVPFGQGRYFANVIVSNSNGELVINHIQACTFEITNVTSTRGVVSLPIEVKSISEVD